MSDNEWQGTPSVEDVVRVNPVRSFQYTPHRAVPATHFHGVRDRARPPAAGVAQGTLRVAGGGGAGARRRPAIRGAGIDFAPRRPARAGISGTAGPGRMLFSVHSESLAQSEQRAPPAGRPIMNPSP
jgi:hypothetical protein